MFLNQIGPTKKDHLFSEYLQEGEVFGDLQFRVLDEDKAVEINDNETTIIAELGRDCAPTFHILLGF